MINDTSGGYKTTPFLDNGGRCYIIILWYTGTHCVIYYGLSCQASFVFWLHRPHWMWLVLVLGHFGVLSSKTSIQTKHRHMTGSPQSMENILIAPELVHHFRCEEGILEGHPRQQNTNPPGEALVGILGQSLWWNNSLYTFMNDCLCETVHPFC